MKYFKNTLLIIASLLLLTACGETTVDDNGLQLYRWNAYEMRVPASWEQVEKTQMSTPVRGTVELAMRSLVSNRGFMNNLTVLSDTVQSETATSSEYMRQTMLWASREYLSTTIENEESVTFADGTTSALVIFHAKYNEITEEHLFMQTARICGKTVYLITLWLENDTAADTYDRYRPILASFTCK